jgi:hypothetical protein
MKNFPFYLVILLFFMSLSSELWSEGMFMDGLIRVIEMLKEDI